MPPLTPIPERPKKLRKGLKNDFDAIDLRIFLSIDEATTLGDVASKLGLSVPAISVRISKLEEALDIALIQHNPLRTTEAGRFFKQYAENESAAKRKLLLDIAGLKSDAGSLRVIAIPSVLIDIAYPILAETRHEFIHIDTTFIDGAATKIIEYVQDGRADIGLIGRDAKIEGLVFERFRTTQSVLLMHGDHPLRELNAARLKDVEPFPLVSLPETSLLAQRIIAAQISTGTILSSSHAAPDIELAALYASTTPMGLCIALEDVAKRYVTNYAAKIVYFSEPWRFFELYTVTREIERRSDAMTFFINKLRQKYKDT